ncbi:MAG TPA: DUF3137 domain-containing protein [Mycobacteriales bacterium]|jgi:hypothetical protein|nr:DUF3137 domain-containing protein [Mycobacteriales bacterium]
MASPVPFVLLAGIPVVAFVAYQSWRQDQRRRQQLLTWAGKNGYTYLPEDDSWCERWTGDPFGEGDHRRAQNVITGTAKAPFSAFDYSYQTHSSDGRGGRTTTTHHYAVTSLQLAAYLPTLQVTPENVLTRIGHSLGLDDIDLESEDFNRRFRVHASDRKFASDVLTPRTMQSLLARPALSFRIAGSDILTWADARMSPLAVTKALSTLELVVDGIPSFVWKDHS